jgi:hypothetical protein
LVHHRVTQGRCGTQFKDLGITPDQSFAWQQLAAIPAPEVRSAVVALCARPKGDDHALAFLGLDVAPAEMPLRLRALHAWLDTWHGMGLIEQRAGAPGP